ncbi:hypothetical protein EGH25_11020 [Haladaptatus sp. F3-133]|uniref:Uncharacterized protein n=1 Tax=Halorutilus salinus TaxID=2487751 RepID=A0A9Q4C5Y3_9EURY|nr:hypothetical protein [Halorutilus salinus]MCX2819881.1 hypothetical protein [Halorutilus salinus]
MGVWTTVNAKIIDNEDENIKDRRDELIKKWYDNDSVDRIYYFEEYVYATAATPSYSFAFKYPEYIDEVIVLEADDTTDQGTATYFPDPEGENPTPDDRYTEEEVIDGRNVGKLALTVVGGRHKFVARDPYHNSRNHIFKEVDEDSRILE